MLVVQKFGGSSVADAECIRRVADIIAEEKNAGNSVVVVLSAAGKDTDKLAKKAVEISPSPPKRELDVLLSTGELGSVSLMAMQLSKMDFDCVSLSGRQAGIVTDTVHGSARIKNINTTRLKRELARGKIVIVAGFQGIDENDDVTTLGRGGSDTTAVALAAALKAQRCEIYTDVDGIYTADPRLVKDAKKLSEVDYDDMLLLAQNGSQVLHPSCIEKAMKSNIEILLLSSFERKSGSVVKRLADRPDICGVTRDKAKNTVSIVGSSVNFGTLQRAVAVLKEAEIEAIAGGYKKGVVTVTVAPEHVLPTLRIFSASRALSE